MNIFPPKEIAQYKKLILPAIGRDQSFSVEDGRACVRMKVVETLLTS